MAVLPVELDPDAWELFDVSLAPTAAGLCRYFERVLAHCERTFQASSISLFLRDSASRRFRLVARNGTAWRIPEEAIIEEGIGFAGQAIERRASAVVRAPSEIRNVGSAMVVPLVLGGAEPLGVLNLSRSVGQIAFGEDDLRYADTVARQLALAVGNAQLYSEAREAEARMRSLLEAIPTPMLVLDSEGVVTEANGPARAIPELPPLQVQGRCEHKGRVFWIQSRPIPTGGAVLTVDDVTEREQEAREASTLRHLAEIGQMTATIAHEVRNPLTGIRSAAQMMEEAPELAAEWAGIIREEAKRMEELCDQFLAFAKPPTLDVAPVRLREIANRIGQLLAPMFAEADLRLEIEANEELPIMADAARIEQVLQNLLRNAAQASSAGGRVVVTVEQGVIRVQDYGKGMTAEELVKAGQPFYTTKTRGTGLGLSTSRKIVEAHGGSLYVESVIGAGTTVTVDLSAISGPSGNES